MAKLVTALRQLNLQRRRSGSQGQIRARRKQTTLRQPTKVLNPRRTLLLSLANHVSPEKSGLLPLRLREETERLRQNARDDRLAKLHRPITKTKLSIRTRCAWTA
jgi:hypothetical protein